MKDHKSYIITFLLLTLPITLLFSQTFQGYVTKGNKISVNVGEGTYLITPFSERIIKVEFLPDGAEEGALSFAVVTPPEEVAFRLSETADSLHIRTDGIAVHMGKTPFGMRFSYRGEQLMESGFPQKRNEITLQITEEEVLYGGGARVLGMNRRGHKLQLYNRAHYGYETHSELMNYALPLFLSSKRYAVLFDNASSGWLDLDSEKQNRITYEASGGSLNYYVIADSTWYGLTEAYTGLTGRQPLLPRWALGNFTSRFGYHSQKEVLNTLAQYKKYDIPVEAAIIDIYWFGKGIFHEMGNLAWYRDSFPNPSQMITKLNEEQIKTILVTEPFILTTSQRWEEACKEQVLCTDSLGNPFTYDFYFGHTGLVDIFKPEAKKWFWSIYHHFIQEGIGGWWGDLGEPEVHPSDLQHVNGSADELHNAYGHEWAKMIYQGYERDFPQQRPFILMRAGYAGSQRYGIIPWSGDVSRSWGGLYAQPEISLQMGMQGLAYMHSDLGGFAGGDSIDNELYIRWLQYGVFQPIYRPHAQEHIAPEPVFQHDTTRAHAKNAIQLRYQLLPYLYNMVYENHRTGKPLMIPLFYEFPENSALWSYDSSYLWGDAFLVTPVKEPGIKHMKIYLPGEEPWVDFYTGQTYKGGKHITVPITIDHLPLFVKSGSLIPMSTSKGNTAHYDLNHLEMHYYAKEGKASYQLYHDDGTTPHAEEKGEATFYHFSTRMDNQQLELSSLASGYPQEPITFTWVIHNLPEIPTQIVDAKGAPLNFDWDASQNVLTIPHKLSKTITIHLTKKHGI